MNTESASASTTPSNDASFRPVRGDSTSIGGERHPWRYLGFAVGITLLIGLPVRLIVAERAVMLSRDAVYYIWYAQSLTHDPVASIRGHAHHPLFPTLVLGAHAVIEHMPILPASIRHDEVKSWVLAAVGASMLGGLVVIVMCYALTARLFNPMVGLVAALLAAAAAEFVQLSADGLGDMPHLAVYLAAMWAALRGLDAQTRQYRWFFVAGLLAGVGFLFRPEGAEPAVVLVFLLGLRFLRQPQRLRTLGAAACVLAGAAIVASPYMLLTGKLVQKKSIGQLLHLADASRGSLDDEITPWHVEQAGAAGDVPRAAWPILENWGRSLRGMFALPVVAWFIWRRRMPTSQQGLRLIESGLGLHLAILVALLVQFNYWEHFSLRHAMVLAALTLPFAAAGVVLFIEALPESRQGWASALIGLVLVVPTLPWMLQERFREDAHFRTASAWMLQHSTARPRIMTDRYTMVFYAKGDYIPAPYGLNADEHLAEARRSRPEWVVYDERRVLKESPEFFDQLIAGLMPGERLKLEAVPYTTDKRGQRRVLICKYVAPPAASAVDAE